MDKFDLSVVVPVYNLKKYVEECVDSFFPTKYKIEVILVDDGSTDGSGEICDKLAGKYDSVKVVHKENRGVADTRNAGIKTANADYVAFVDGDDKVISGAFDSIIEKLDGKTEIFTFNFYEYYGDGTKREMTHLNSSLLYGEDGKMSENLFKSVSPLPMPWLYVVKRDYLIKNELFMHVGLLDEDEEWTARLFAKNPTVKCFEYRYYLYRRDVAGSLTFNRKVKNTLSDIKIIEILDEEKKNDSYTDTGRKILDNKRRQMVNKVLSDLPYLNKAERKEIKRKIKPYRKLLKSGTKMDKLHYRFDWLFGRNGVNKIADAIYRLKHRG